MIRADSRNAERARMNALDLLNQHLAAAVILQDRMMQSSRHIRGHDFILVDDLCNGIAHLMDRCVAKIVGRVADLGGTPEWPVQLSQWSPIRVQAVSDPVRVAELRRFGVPANHTGPLDAFAQSVLDAAAVAQAYGDETTADLLAQVWRDVDRHLWRTVKTSAPRPLAS